MNIVTDGDGKVLMWSDRGSPTPPVGGQVVRCCAKQAAEFRALPPNDGVMFDGQELTLIPPAEPPPAPTAAEKLAATGLTVDELRQLLGLS